MRARWQAIAGLVWVACRASPAGAWFCSPQDTPEAEAREALFTQFRDNYFISGAPWGATKTDPRHYVRFQLSIKFNMIPTRSPCTLFFTFTQKSLWKLWSLSPSFEDSNYNPAFLLAWRSQDFTSQLRLPPGGLRVLGVFAGYEHESNGRSVPDARGWDRASAFARFGYYFGDRFLGGGWHIVVEPKVWWPFLPADNPPDFLDYLGYGQLSLEVGRESENHDPMQGPGGMRYVYRDFVFALLGRPGKRFDRGYLEASIRWRPIQIPQVSWSLLAQLATGYSETFSRYNESLPPTIRIGIALDDRISSAPATTK
jgi:outer membrane phospholipase A